MARVIFFESAAYPNCASQKERLIALGHEVESFDLLNEPLHLHIANQKSHRQYTAKIWLSSLEYAEPGSLNQIELNSIQKVVKRYQSQLIIALEFLQNGKGIQTIKMR